MAPSELSGRLRLVGFASALRRFKGRIALGISGVGRLVCVAVGSLALGCFRSALGGVAVWGGFLSTSPSALRFGVVMFDIPTSALRLGVLCLTFWGVMSDVSG